MDNPRKPHEDIFGIDKYNMQSLQSLLDKYSKDYLGFFYNLSALYPEGSPRNKEIKETLILVDNARDLLKTIIASGSITDEDVKKITDLSKIIEEKKLESLGGVEKTQELQEKLEKAAKTTGISPEDLSVTQEVTKTAIQIARERLEQPSRLRRAAGAFRPAAGAAGRAAVKALPAIGLAALGPFYPLAKLLVKEEVRERRALKAPRAAELQPEAGEADWGELNGAQEPDTAGRRQGRVVLDYSAALEHFFDKGGAYRARWTRELLDNIKGAGDRGERESAGILSTYLPVIAAGIAIISGWKLLEAINAWTGLEKAAAGARESADMAKAVREAEEKRTKVIGLPAAAAERGITEEKYIDQMARRKLQEQETRKAGMPLWTKALGGAIGKTFGWDRPEVKLPEMREEFEQMFKYESPIARADRDVSRARAEMGRGLFPSFIKPEIERFGPRRGTAEEAYPIPEVSHAEPSAAANLEWVESLNRAIDNLASQVQENGTDGGKTPILGNIHDSGDVLIQELAAGYLTLGR